jgi:dopamine beta-monooxygenase
VFKTTSKENFTYFGMGTNDEMCFGGITFYPQQNVKHQFCTTWKSIPVCQLRKPVIRGCHIKQFANISHPEFVDMREAVMDHCSTNSTCFKECEHHSKIIKSHPCMNGDVGEIFRHRIERMMDDRVTQFYQGMDSCSAQLDLLSEQNIAMVTKNNFVLMIALILASLVTFY